MSLTARNILLVGKDQQQCILHLTIANDLVQLGLGLLDTASVVGVDNKDKSLGTCTESVSLARSSTQRLAHTGVVVSPQRTNLVLTTDVPDVKFDVLVGHALDVEPDGGDGGDILVELQLVQDSCAELSAQHTFFHTPTFDLFILVFPAASRPSIRMRISLDPKILLINLDTEPPIVNFRLAGIGTIENLFRHVNLSAP